MVNRMRERLQKSLEEMHSVHQRFMEDKVLHERLLLAAQLIAEAIRRGNKVLSCGNGGSMSDAMHFAEELTGRYRENRTPLPAIAISDPGYLSCTANDFGYEVVFSRFVEGVGRPGDVLLAISTSGNSKNVIKAAEQARRMGIKVIGLTGNDGGKLAPLCDIELRAPHHGYADRIQEIHIRCIHLLIELIEAHFMDHEEGC